MTDHNAWKLKTVDELLRYHDDGAAMNSATELYRELVEVLMQKHLDGHVGAAGEVNIKIMMKTTPQRIETKVKVDGKLPKGGEFKREYWVTEDNLLSPRKPGQHDIEDLPLARKH